MITRYFYFVLLKRNSLEYFLGNWLSSYKVLRVLAAQPIKILNIDFGQHNVQLDPMTNDYLGFNFKRYL